MKSRPFVLLASVLATLLSYTSAAQDFSNLNIMTEDFPPFNYLKNDQPSGRAVDMLIKASAAVGKPISKEQIHLITWARAYQTVLSGPNALLFSMTRTEARENLFKWAGPIGQNRVVIWAKKSSGIGKINDLTTLTERIGIVRDTVGDQLIIAAGVPDEQLVRNSKPDGAAKMLASGRVKLWAYSENSAIQQLNDIGENIDDYEIAYILKSKDLYFAFSKDVDDAVVQLLQKGIDMSR
jgi:polar amino acid transport system substrate-binding protein